LRRATVGPTRRLRYLLSGLALASTVIAPATAAAASPTAGSIGVRLVDEPATANQDPRARLYIVDHLAPGTVIHRRIEVANSTGSNMRVVLYPAAASIAQGSFLGAVGRIQNDLSSWMSVDPSAPNVGAGGRITATVTIAVPGDAAPGEQYAVVWAETNTAPTTSGVTQVSRAGIRIYLSVGPGGPPPANFTIDALTAKRSPEGQPIVVATVHNTGGRALDMSGTLQLVAGPGELSAGPFPAALGVTLAIGDTEPVTITLDKRLPAGPWNARILLHSGLLERSASATITFPDIGTAPSVNTTSTQTAWSRPAIAGLIIVLATALLVVTIRRRRRPPAARRAPRTLWGGQLGLVLRAKRSG
jgi:hypothetical protein